MCGAAVCINVRSIRLTVDDIGFRTKCIIYTFCNCKCTSIWAVQADSLILKRTCSKSNEIANISVSTCRIINSTANIFFFCKRKLTDFAVYILFNLFLYLCLHLVAFSVDNLNSIVIVRIMACWNHDSTVKVLCSCHIGYAGRCRYVKKVRICTRSGQSCSKGIFEHIAASSCIFSDNNLCLMLLSIIPSKISSYFKCMFNCQYFICFTAEAVCSKIFSHTEISSISFDVLFFLSKKDTNTYYYF